MDVTTKSKIRTSNENWGMALLLVFFREATDINVTAADTTITTTPTTFSPSSSPSSVPFSSSLSSASSRTIKRTLSNSPILTKAQSTISICALLLFLTLALFTFSTFEPTASIDNAPRRLLSSSQGPPDNFPKTQISNQTKLSWFRRILRTNDCHLRENSVTSFALQGLGKLYRRGTKAMSNLVVGHVVEDTNEDELRLFLRALHRSSLTARADMVFLFESSSFASRFEALIEEENKSFLKLIHQAVKVNFTSHDSEASGFDAARFITHSKKEEAAEPLWGKKIRVDDSRNESGVADESGELTRLSFGSIAGFEANELDPENSLAGFLHHVPLSLRRWACYPMLLGRVRRSFKHIILVDVKNMALHGDPLSRIRNSSPESVHVLAKQEDTGKHSKTNSAKSGSQLQVSPTILMGGSRGIRRLSIAMLTEVVRAALQHKKKSSVTEIGILSQLVGNGHLLKNIDLIVSPESILGSSS